MPLQVQTVPLAVDVSTTLNATVTSGDLALPAGSVIREVAVFAFDTATEATEQSIPHGRVYTRVYAFSKSLKQPMCTLWAGYVTRGAPVSRIECPVVASDWVLRVDATQTGAGASVSVIAMAHTDAGPLVGGASPWFEPPGSGIGEERLIQVAAPGAGSTWSQAVPAKAKWRVKGAHMTLAAAVAVANRFVCLRVDDAAGTPIDAYANRAQTATETVEYDFFPGAGDRSATINGVLNSPMMPGADLLAGNRVFAGVGGIQAADQFSNVTVKVEEWAIP